MVINTFDLQEVVTATLDLEDVRSYRGERCHPHMVGNAEKIESILNVCLISWLYVYCHE